MILDPLTIRDEGFPCRTHILTHMSSHLIKAFASAAFIAVLSLSASAQSLRTLSGTPSTLSRNDDLSTGLVSLGFAANFYGHVYTNTFVNNNGNLTFNDKLATYTPFGIQTSAIPIIAPFFADVDTRGSGSAEVTYGSGLLGGHNAFSANYVDVGVFSQLPIYNTFQVVLIDRSEILAGDFDIEFNYTKINWETGTMSGGDSSGLGGFSAHVGFTSGGTIPTSYEFTGSGVNGAFLDANLSSGLIYHSFGTPFDESGQSGRYTYNVRNGEVQPPVTPVPEPSTYGLMGATGLLGFAFVRRRLARKA